MTSDKKWRFDILKHGKKSTERTIQVKVNDKSIGFIENTTASCEIIDKFMIALDEANAKIERLEIQLRTMGVLDSFCGSCRQSKQIIDTLKGALKEIGCNETYHRLGGIDDCTRCKALKQVEEMENITNKE